MVREVRTGEKKRERENENIIADKLARFLLRLDRIESSWLCKCMMDENNGKKEEFLLFDRVRRRRTDENVIGRWLSDLFTLMTLTSSPNRITGREGKE